MMSDPATDNSVDWAAIKRAYQSVEKLGDLAALHGLAVQKIVARARAENWPLRKDKRKKTKQAKKRTRIVRKAEEVQPVQVAAKGAVTSAALRVRLTRLVERQIRDSETRMEKGKSAADHERDARTLSSLTRTLEKLVELRRDAAQERARRKRESEESNRQGTRADEQSDRDIRGELERRLSRLAADETTKGVSARTDGGRGGISPA